MSQHGLPGDNSADHINPVRRTNTDELIESYLNLTQPAVSGTDFSDVSNLPSIMDEPLESDDPPVAPTSYFPPQQSLPQVQGSLFAGDNSLANSFTSHMNDESAFLDDDNFGAAATSTALDGQFLIPGNTVGHYRSDSVHSDATSIAHSPFPASPPLLPPTASSPAFYGDNNAVTGLEQITGNFSLGDSSFSGFNNTNNNTPPIHTTGPTDNSIYPTSSGQSNDFAAATPEIMVETVHVSNTFSPYASSPGSISPSYSDMEPFPSAEYDHTALLPPTTNRRRSHSDSDLTGANGGGFLYMNGNHNGSNVSIGSATSDAPSYLSPEMATTRHERQQRQAMRNRSNSASQARSRSRSRSQSASREYILELASATPGTKRVQRHPSTFACDMCDKKFTRAYNLRSHKRTHTDERPYACTVCDKTFARQHDRKRHEALHSGEKKFMCQGVLADGVTPWGCGHKFARADALGRHFRTEAGKECIRPLVEESERERRASVMGNGGVPIYGGNEDAPALTLSPPPSNEAANGMFPNNNRGSGGSGGGMINGFPAALLEQFPALSGFFQNDAATA